MTVLTESGVEIGVLRKATHEKRTHMMDKMVIVCHSKEADSALCCDVLNVRNNYSRGLRNARYEISHVVELALVLSDQYDAPPRREGRVKGSRLHCLR
jgi:hypothetical protein